MKSIGKINYYKSYNLYTTKYNRFQIQILSGMTNELSVPRNYTSSSGEAVLTRQVSDEKFVQVSVLNRAFFDLSSSFPIKVRKINFYTIYVI